PAITVIGIDATPVRADYLKAASFKWPRIGNFVLTEVAVHEYLGILRYHVYNAMGWNDGADTLENGSSRELTEPAIAN
ncbi:MAG: hypothetical protein ACTS5I_04940, partial [Rhodanobacter sp.]